MQAIEIEIDISHDGHIRLAESLELAFCRLARLPLLLDDAKPMQTPASNAISAFGVAGREVRRCAC